jgi:hypothetical protein
LSFDLPHLAEVDLKWVSCSGGSGQNLTSRDAMKVQFLALLLHIQEVLNPNLGVETGYSDSRFLIVFLNHYWQLLGQCFILDHEVFLPHSFQFMIY